MTCNAQCSKQLKRERERSDIVYKICKSCGTEFQFIPKRGKQPESFGVECSKKIKSQRELIRKKDPEYIERQRKLKKEWLKKPEVRDRERARQRRVKNELLKDPQYRALVYARRKKRMEDPQYRERAYARHRAWRKNPSNAQWCRDNSLARYRKLKLSQNTLKLAHELQQLKKHLTEKTT